MNELNQVLEWNDRATFWFLLTAMLIFLPWFWVKAKDETHKQK